MYKFPWSPTRHLLNQQVTGKKPGLFLNKKNHSARSSPDYKKYFLLIAYLVCLLASRYNYISFINCTHQYDSILEWIIYLISSCLLLGFSFSSSLIFQKDVLYFSLRKMHCCILFSSSCLRMKIHKTENHPKLFKRVEIKIKYFSQICNFAK